ncbi:MAG: hypothetical protein OEL89_01190 [Candidatus Peregrinibacteria bacterium]|nr:hypothetical protein [Candidatus Peregrinibacteria bacterium]
MKEAVAVLRRRRRGGVEITIDAIERGDGMRRGRRDTRRKRDAVIVPSKGRSNDGRKNTIAFVSK